jgi:hypothetical protein
MRLKRSRLLARREIALRSAFLDVRQGAFGSKMCPGKWNGFGRLSGHIIEKSGNKIEFENEH